MPPPTKDFHALPDRKRYPDYYEAIPEPVCLDEVEVGRVYPPQASDRTADGWPSSQNKLDRKEFSSAQAFVVALQVRGPSRPITSSFPFHALMLGWLIRSVLALSSSSRMRCTVRVEPLVEVLAAACQILTPELDRAPATTDNEDDSSIWKDAKRLDVGPSAALRIHRSLLLLIPLPFSLDQDLVHELYATAEEEGILPPKEPSNASPSKAGGAAASISNTAGASGSSAAAAAGAARSMTPASPAPPGGALTLAMLPKKRGRPTKEEAAARAAAGYVKKPPRIKNKPQQREGSTPAAGGGTPGPGRAATLPPPPTPTPAPVAALPAVSVASSKPIDVSIPWETYTPPSPSKMSEPSLSDQDESARGFYEVVRAMDERLARIEGFEVDQGWWSSDGGEAAYQEVLAKLKAFVGPDGRRMAEALEEVPMQTDNELLSFQVRLSSPPSILADGR